MVQYKNECVDCGLPCLGESCPYKKVEYHYCDCCDDEIDYDDIKRERNNEYCPDCWSVYFTDDEE